MRFLFSLLLLLGVAFEYEAAAQLTLTYTTTDNSVCAPEPCTCKGKLTSITFLYRGDSGVTITAHNKKHFTNHSLLKTFTNVQDGQTITITNQGNRKIGPHTFLWISGTSKSSAVDIKTDCAQISMGASYGPYTVIGYTDKDGNTCNTQHCTGSIDLTVTGGVPPYTYKWSNGGSAQDQSNLCSDTYKAEVKDSKGKKASLRIRVGLTSTACDDNNMCTVDRCYHERCRYIPMDCNDHNPCTTDECNNGECVHASFCDDSNLCTTDECDDEDCFHVAVNCDDHNACTEDNCANGNCANVPLDCNDNNACTTDECFDGQCSNILVPGCGDPCYGVLCNDEEVCMIAFCLNGECFSTPVNCDDNNPCTNDFCNGGQCVFSEITCNDNNICTFDECYAGECSNILIPGCGDPCFGVICNDDDACTVDFCLDGECWASTITCEDNNPCTGDYCSAGQCHFDPIPGCGNPCENSTLDASVSGTSPSPCDACNGLAEVNATGGTPPYTYSWSTGETSQSIGNNSGYDICVNAGGNQYTSAAGDDFAADAYYGGTSFIYSNSNISDIANTTDDELYKTERNTTSSMTYSFPVSNGQYKVELHFAELYFGVEGGNMTQPFTGKRLFDVFIEGSLVLDNYDINADAGPAAAVVKSFLTGVSDGVLNIDFVSVVNRAKISAICVKPIGGHSGLCSGTYTATVTDANGCTTTASISLCAGDPCSNVICDDHNSCTTDFCSAGECYSTPVDCNDNTDCTSDECIDGECLHNSSLRVNTHAVNPYPCNTCNGSATALPAGGTPPYSYSWSNGELTQSLGGQAATTSRCINAGGNEYISSANETFESDWDYSGVTFMFSNYTVADIANTTDDELFRTERNTMDSMFYHIPVTNGNYDVELYFAELYFGVDGGNMTQPFTGRRIFDVFIEGVLVMDNYDINADVGPATAVIKTFTATVTDQTLSIKLVAVTNRAKISAICLKPSADQPAELCAGTYTVTVTDAAGCTAETTVILCNGQKLSDNDLKNQTVGSPSVADLSAYPVPFDESLNLNFTASENGIAEIRIFDMLGQAITKQQLNFVAGENLRVIELDGSMATGMYFLEFRTGEKTEFIKIYKSK